MEKLEEIRRAAATALADAIVTMNSADSRPAKEQALLDCVDAHARYSLMVHLHALTQHQETKSNGKPKTTA